MCNEVARRIELGLIREDFNELKIPLRFPEGFPNMEPLASVRITDPTVIVRAVAQTPSEAELITRRWSWPGAGGKPVYNYRSEGRDFRNSAKQGRCLIPVDGFYEFTTPADPAKKRKDKWLFRWKDELFFCIAGLWKRDEPAIADTRNEAFTLLTCEPGPDIAPYHRRQIVLLGRSDWAGWLSGETQATELLKPLPAGTLTAEQIG